MLDAYDPSGPLAVFVDEMQTRIEDLRRRVADLPLSYPVDDRFSDAQRGEFLELRCEIARTMEEHIGVLERAIEKARRPLPPESPEQKAARAAFLDDLVAQTRVACPPAFVDFDDKPFEERSRLVALALRRLDRRAALGTLDALDDKNRGYLTAEIAFLERTQRFDAHRTEAQSEAPANPHPSVLGSGRDRTPIRLRPWLEWLLRERPELHVARGLQTKWVQIAAAWQAVCEEDPVAGPYLLNLPAPLTGLSEKTLRKHYREATGA